jgi:hypothetical protein
MSPVDEEDLLELYKEARVKLGRRFRNAEWYVNYCLTTDAKWLAAHDFLEALEDEYDD